MSFPNSKDPTINSRPGQPMLMIGTWWQSVSTMCFDRFLQLRQPKFYTWSKMFQEHFDRETICQVTRQMYFCVLSLSYFSTTSTWYLVLVMHCKYEVAHPSYVKISSPCEARLWPRRNWKWKLLTHKRKEKQNYFIKKLFKNSRSHLGHDGQRPALA